MRIFVNGRLRTLDREAPVATAMAVEAGTIVAVGGDRSIRGGKTATDEIVDLEGRVVLPGFHDSHIHLTDGAIALTRVDLREATSAESASALVRERAAGVVWGRWVRGFGWDHTKWPGGAWPERRILDAAVSEYPVALSRIDGHVGWVSSLALRALGIGRDTPDPPGGTIVRDPATREPTGVLIETAWDNAQARIPKEKKSERKAALVRALRELARLGITSVQDITDAQALPILAELRAEGALTARVSALLPIDLDRAAAEALLKTHAPDDPWLGVGTLKVFLDGTLGSRSAALRAPYADDPASSGTLRLEAQQLQDKLRDADERGWAVAIHAIGDLAVRTALDALERLPKKDRVRPHRIEHVQVVSAEDIPRFRQLGVVASIQPVHFREDLPWIAERLGERGGARLYPVRSLFDAGATVAFGTDWPIAPLDPWLGIAAATASRGPTSDAGAVGGLDEQIPLDAAIRAYSETPARICGKGARLGRLAPGCLADFVVLDRDPAGPLGLRIGVAPEVVRTYVGGKCVYPEESR